MCIEVVLEADAGVLLAKREIEPRVWFWPGSRLYKGEELDDDASGGYCSRENDARTGI